MKNHFTSKKSILIISLIFIFGIFSPLFVRAEFNPNYIISDDQILDYNSMTFSEIQNFLTRKGGYLAGYSAVNPDGLSMLAAEIIYDRAQTNKISPKFIIVMLQKEMSLIEHKSPGQSRLDWALGYGCPDSGGCNERWRGLWKQINSATLQFYDYLENSQNYRYRKGETYTFENKFSNTIQGTIEVTPANSGTAAMYNYTPHVYDGNYNFYNIWQRYFFKSYPDGTLMQVKGEDGVWLIQKGQKRPFLSKSALTSRFDINKVIMVDKGDLDKYEDGSPIKHANYSLLRSPGGHLYLIVDDKRRGFTSQEAFRKIGYNPAEIVDTTWEDIKLYEEIEPITATSAYPTGALLQDKETGGVYWVEEGKKSPLLDRAFLTVKFKNKKIIPASQQDLEKYPTIPPIMFGDGELLTSPETRTIYLVYDGKKRPFTSADLFERLGYKWENIISVSANLLSRYENGNPIREITFN